ncbi:hypothetical protein [Gordonia sp. (in: high G+C Gram-positive bacteria)]|uniref:hypothetical protein n=1 Tax=unclassified Gordonia (in: high G+C Gram-positive bacteria) TaxID=2657482 RepID=UPI002607B922|nr:hypothetical protein [Gordonia sp. (in: high G+C Gram-positive bacteria)]
MSQLSLFSAETEDPAIDDLAGLLAAQGQSTHMAFGARVSVVVAARWRAQAICDDIRATGLEAEIAESEEGSPMARTEANPRLTALHRRWSAGAVKTVPEAWAPSPRALRLWVLASGHPEGAHYVLGLDPHAPDTHGPLATALMRVGIAPTLVGSGGQHPALRVTGRKRRTRLLETVGGPPPVAEAYASWPTP